MVFHDWSDDTFPWKDLDDSISLISDYLQKVGRMPTYAKEKWGCARISCHFGLSLHNLMFPRYYFRYHDLFAKHKWLINFDNFVFIPFMGKLGVTKLWFKWQSHVYNTAYQMAIKKYPHLRGEILCNADQLEFIKGVTRKEETQTESLTHVLGWNGETLSTWRSSKRIV